MDPSIRTQQRSRYQQNEAKGFRLQSRDIPETASDANTPPPPIILEKMSMRSTAGNTFMTAVVLISSYIVYKIYLRK